MKIPIILGLSLPIWGGIILVLLIVFQVINGMGIIKVPQKVHKINAYTILAFGIIHAVLGLGLWFGWFTF